jgi:hypothetical protein
MNATATEQKAPTADDRGPKPVTTKEALKKRAIHEGVTLPSGSVVTVKLPNLYQLIAEDKLPNDLVDSALKQLNAKPERDEEGNPVGPAITRELIAETWDFTKHIVPTMLPGIDLAEDELGEVDPRDVEWLIAAAARRTDLDAVGHQLGGLDTVKSFRELHGIFSIAEALEGGEGSG